MSQGSVPESSVSLLALPSLGPVLEPASVLPSGPASALSLGRELELVKVRASASAKVPASEQGAGRLMVLGVVCSWAMVLEPGPAPLKERGLARWWALALEAASASLKGRGLA
jgi:hypothetical protein